uniref:TGF_BETA_2 domain-containing protein n=1 Tax=Gongylonema pulchrum TaxID=637853 RepID=A0A183ELH7_9BILA
LRWDVLAKVVESPNPPSTSAWVEGVQSSVPCGYEIEIAIGYGGFVDRRVIAAGPRCNAPEFMDRLAECDRDPTAERCPLRMVKQRRKRKRTRFICDLIYPNAADWQRYSLSCCSDQFHTVPISDWEESVYSALVPISHYPVCCICYVIF